MVDAKQELADFEARSVGIDRSRIQDEFCEVSSDLAFWGERLSVLEGALVRAKANIDQVRAKTDGEIRAALAVRGDKVTESRVEILVDGSPEVAEAQEILAQVTAERQRLRGIVDAVATKSQMLMSLGAMLRQEMKGDPSLYG